MESLSVVTAAATEPLTAQEVYEQFLELPCPDAAQKAMITRLIPTARDVVEHAIERRLVTQTLLWKFDAFPTGRTTIDVPVPPLQAVNSIKYYDEDNVLQTYSSSNYEVDTEGHPGRVQPTEDEEWPDTEPRIEAVEVNFDCGYGAASAVPEVLKTAIGLLVVQYFENRLCVGDISPGIRSLLDAERWVVRVS